MKRVEVVVLNWNGWRDTLNCIRSLQCLDYPNYGLIVVDNGSTDESVAHILSHRPEVELILTGANLGFGGGCNVGIRKALERGADYIWLINSDSTVDCAALSELVKTAEANLQLGAVGSVLYEAGTVDQIQLWGGGKVVLWSGRSQHQLHATALDFVSGASMLLRREALTHVGLFDDQSFFMYWEDTDLGFRLRKSGWQLAVADRSFVWHKQSASLGKGSLLLDEYFTCSGVRFLRRHAPAPWLAVFALMGRLLLKRLILGEFARGRAVLKGYVKA
jgi:GT2 family glycosyltransferase